jgi:hypothetical protein
VEAYDSEGDRIGTSEIKSFEVAALPLLEAPELDLPEGGEFIARPDGSLFLQWDGLAGAKDYQVLVRDSAGSIVTEQTTTTPSFKLTNLLPGNYTLQIGATDPYGRRGGLTPARRVTVPNKSEVQAPKLRKIKVN